MRGLVALLFPYRHINQTPQRHALTRPCMTSRGNPLLFIFRILYSYRFRLALRARAGCLIIAIVMMVVF